MKRQIEECVKEKAVYIALLPFQADQITRQRIPHLGMEVQINTGFKLGLPL